MDSGFFAQCSRPNFDHARDRPTGRWIVFFCAVEDIDKAHCGCLLYTLLCKLNYILDTCVKMVFPLCEFAGINP